MRSANVTNKYPGIPSALTLEISRDGRSTVFVCYHATPPLVVPLNGSDSGSSFYKDSVIQNRTTKGFNALALKALFGGFLWWVE